jgi:HK97 gp10 family phage protein
MQSDGFKFELSGIDDLKRAMADVGASIRKKAVRAALRQAGTVINAQARADAPVLKKATPYRKPGTVKKRITVRASKFARREGNEGVYVSVRPLRGAAQTKRFGKAGAKNPNDPFYWRFLEFGTKFIAPLGFMRGAAESKGKDAIDKFMSVIIPQIERLNKRVR